MWVMGETEKREPAVSVQLALAALAMLSGCQQSPSGQPTISSTRLGVTALHGSTADHLDSPLTARSTPETQPPANSDGRQAASPAVIEPSPYQVWLGQPVDPEITRREVRRFLQQPSRMI